LGPYFNILPTVLIGLMIVQQKMFMPPKTDPPDPQVEMQQKLMLYMLVFFGIMFWTLPSGLCVYYIASTTWGIIERKLLPKLQPVASKTADEQKKATDHDSSGRKGRAADREGRRPERDGKGRKPERTEPSLTDRLRALIKQASKH
jgi:YidC/Oxa1 family membrane protein insertase